MSGAASVHGELEQRLVAGRPSFAADLAGLQRRIVAAVVGGRPRAIGRYRLIEVLGSGAFGTVHAAVDERLDRRVALKLVAARTPEAIARVLREARTLAALSHPNVVHVFEYGTTDDDAAPYVVMEYVEGENLRTWFGVRPRPWREVVDVVIQAGRGLAAAHTAGVLHRDLKPENVMVGRDGRVRVIDFGLARGPDGHEPVTGDAHELPLSSQLTPTGYAMGTPAYMAPEVFQREATPAADQYALAVVAYEGLFGARPYAARTTEELHAQMQTHEPRVPADPGVPAAVCAALTRALRRDPARRFADVDAFVAALERARRGPRLGPWSLAAGTTTAIVAMVVGLGTRTPACIEADTAWAEAHAVPRISDRVAHTLTEYERDWRELESRLCAAGEGRIAAGARRCLDTRVRDVTQLLAVMSELRAAGDPVEGDPLAHLPAAAGCGDPSAGADPDGAPLDAIDEQLSRLRALDATARIADGLALSADLLADVRDDGRPAVLAEIEFLRGRMLLVASDYAGAAQMFEDCVVLGEREGLDRLVARAASELVRALASRGHLDEAKRWIPHADAAFARAGLDREAHAPFVEARAIIAEVEGDYPAAIELLQHAAEVGAADGTGHPGVVNHLGAALFRAGQYEAAEVALRKAAWMFEERGGQGTPALASARDNLGATLYQLGRDEEALLEHTEALTIREATLGPDHLDLGASHGNLANVLARMGRRREALDHAERGHALFLRRLGPDHPSVALLSATCTRLRTELGGADRARSIADWRHAIAVLEAAGAVQADNAARVRDELAAYTAHEEPGR